MKNVILLAGFGLTTGLNIGRAGFPQGTQQFAPRVTVGDFEGKAGSPLRPRRQEQSTKDFNR